MSTSLSHSLLLIFIITFFTSIMLPILICQFFCLFRYSTFSCWVVEVVDVVVVGQVIAYTITACAGCWGAAVLLYVVVCGWCAGSMCAFWCVAPPPLLMAVEVIDVLVLIINGSEAPGIAGFLTRMLMRKDILPLRLKNECTSLSSWWAGSSHFTSDNGTGRSSRS